MGSQLLRAGLESTHATRPRRLKAWTQHQGKQKGPASALGRCGRRRGRAGRVRAGAARAARDRPPLLISSVAALAISGRPRACISAQQRSRQSRPPGLCHRAHIRPAGGARPPAPPPRGSSDPTPRDTLPRHRPASNSQTGAAKPEVNLPHPAQWTLPSSLLSWSTRGERRFRARFQIRKQQQRVTWRWVHATTAACRRRSHPWWTGPPAAEP